MKAFASLLAAALAANAAVAAPAPKATAKLATKAVSDEPIKLPLRPIVAAKQQLCTETRPSGLGIKQLKAGEGASPLPGDLVMVNYLGYLRSNGEVFDQSTSAVFPVDGVIAGFAEGIMQMSKGAIVRLCIPAVLGYGVEGTPDGTVPGGADLGFQVELVDFKSQAEIDAMHAQQMLPPNEEAPVSPEPASEIPATPPAPTQQ